MEGATSTANEPVKTPGVIVSAGVPVAGKPNFANPIPGNENGATAASTATPPAETLPAANAAPPPVDDLPKFTDEQLKKILEGTGVTGFENLEDLKAKLQKANTPTPAAPVTLTDDQK